MKKFWSEVWWELKRSIPRTLYFIRHGHLHPEVKPRSTVRLWDKDYKLLWSGESFPAVVTIDQNGLRTSWKVKVVSE